MTHEIQISKNTFINTTIRRRVPLHGVEFDEDFLAELVAKHLREKNSAGRPTMQTAYEIYMAENHSSHRRKFQSNANLYFNNFIELFGDSKHSKFTSIQTFLEITWLDTCSCLDVCSNIYEKQFNKELIYCAWTTNRRGCTRLRHSRSRR